VAGGGLLAATAGIHLDLYLIGYRSIPTIGWLFLLQVIAGFTLAAAVLATGSRLAAAAGAAFALATLAGYLLSVWAGLFGFTEVRTTAGIVAGVIEVAVFAVLASYAAAWPAGHLSPAGPGPAGRAQASRLTGWVRAKWQEGLRRAGLLVTALSVAALALLGAAVAQAPGSAPASAGSGRVVLKTTVINGVTVLTNGAGRTLYWFVPDTPTSSKCTGSCAAYWPPVTGTPVAGPGVTGRLGTIARPGGARQVTYDGHPLYTYAGDTAPGQARGNNLNLNGGLWHEMTVGS
jgi:predicted lipoprotein with Yx(FWY)xxD motif